MPTKSVVEVRAPVLHNCPHNLPAEQRGEVAASVIHMLTLHCLPKAITVFEEHASFSKKGMEESTVGAQAA